MQLIRRMKPRFSRYRQYRFLEMIPGLLVWTTLLAAVGISVVRPVWAIIFIILFDLYWLIRVLYVMTYLIMQFRVYRKTERVNWQERMQTLEGWDTLVHVVVVPTYQEDVEVVRETFNCLLASAYPPERLVVVLATEERDHPRAQQVGEAMQQEFGKRFRSLLVTRHPKNLPGEVAGKGANIAWAGRQVKKYIDQQGLAYERVVVSSFDVDTCVSKQYFSYLTHAYLTHPNPTRTSFQPVPLFTNNIWAAPMLARIAAHSTTFWMLTEHARPERLFTFSSHSMSFRALVDVDFWQSDIVTEDSRIFLQCLLRYDGDYTVTPMPVSVSMDAVRAKTFWRSMVNLYKQQRRWAYGVENFPYMAWFFQRNSLIPLRTKLRYLWNQFEGVYSWATAPLLIFLLGRLPLWFVTTNESGSALVQNAPFVLEQLMLYAMVGLIPVAIFGTILLPRLVGLKRIARIPFMLVEWLLFPIVMLLFGSLPATEAQTRLMLGKYLGFWTTEKGR